MSCLCIPLLSSTLSFSAAAPNLLILLKSYKAKSLSLSFSPPLSSASPPLFRPWLLIKQTAAAAEGGGGGGGHGLRGITFYSSLSLLSSLSCISSVRDVQIKDK